MSNQAVAVLASGDPEVVLDFFIGEYVAVDGTRSGAPASCRTVATRLVAVRQIERVSRPPGGSGAGAPSGFRHPPSALR